MDAQLNITYAGQNGDLVDQVPFDLTDQEILDIAREVVQGGNVPGINATPDPDFSDFVVERFNATDDVPNPRLVVRPKTPFGQ